MRESDLRPHAKRPGGTIALEAGFAARGPILWIALTALSSALAAGCGASRSDSAPPAPPARATRVVSEDRLNQIELTEQAAGRLGIETSRVASKEMQRRRLFGGEVTLPPGALIAIAAPVAGTVLAPPDGTMPRGGAAVEADQPLVALLPLLSPERAALTPSERVSVAQARNALTQSRIEAEAQVEQSRIQVDAAQVAFERAQRLFREQAGTAKAVDDAKAQLDLATKSLETARARRKLVENIDLDEDSAGALQPLSLKAPRGGIVRAWHVAPGEIVPAGSPLFEIMSAEEVWIRVAVYAGELDQLALAADARVSLLSDPQGKSALTARPVDAPPTATALASTVDLYYRLENAEGVLRPGQRVSVQVDQQGKATERTLPWSAVIHDIHGGNWVYERTTPLVFMRRRVQLRFVRDGWAAISQGPDEGAEIVTAGAMELFGFECGFAK